MNPPASKRVSAALREARRRTRSASYRRKWVVLGAGVGIVGGLGAILFYTAVDRLGYDPASGSGA